MHKVLFKSPMRNTNRLVAGVLLALVSATAAHAQYASTTPSNARSPGTTFMGPGSSYIGLSAGASDLRRPITGLNNFGGSAQTAYGVSAGSYFNQNFGLEVGYTDFGSIDLNGGRTKVDGINLSLIGRAPMGSAINLLGKLGTTYSRTDVTASVASGVASGTERGFDWSYGMGAEWVFHPKWSTVLGYDEHYVKYPSTSNERISNTSLTLRYNY